MVERSGIGFAFPALAVAIAGFGLIGTAYMAEIYRAGHIPVLSEWFASPLESIAGSSTANPEFMELIHPIAERLLARCDSVLRVEGLAAGADLIVALARQRGIRVYRDLEDALAG